MLWKHQQNLQPAFQDPHLPQMFEVSLRGNLRRKSLVTYIPVGSVYAATIKWYLTF